MQSSDITRSGKLVKTRLQKSVGSWSLEGISTLDRLDLEGHFVILVVQLIH